MSVSLIVACSENEVIGRDGDMPWRLSADLQRFKKLTMGHHIIMGRKTFDSIGRLLPGRTTVVVSRQAGLKIEGAIVAGSIEAALEIAAIDDEPFVVGGAQIYTAALPFVARIFLTRVHQSIDGDTHMPDIDWGHWKQVEQVRHSADEKNNFDYSFETHDRID